MINTTEFSSRLEQILSYYGLSASAFAAMINVQRSSISHIISGRNKPSLEFVMKLSKSFPEVDLYWLLEGKGSFPTPISEKDSLSHSNLPTKEDIGHKDTSIDRIVIFYSNGSFKDYNPLTDNV